MTERNILDDVFKAPEEAVETFVDILAREGLVTDPEKSDVSRIVSGTPDRVEPPEIIDQTQGLIRIQHGRHGEDYVWHIGPAHEKRPFKVSQDRVIYAIAKVMHPRLPPVAVHIFKPFRDWDIQEYTFKAFGLLSSWPYNNDDVRRQMIGGVNLELFKVLNTLV